MKKLNKNLKQFIKNNYKILILYLILCFICFYKLDYEVYMPGGIINLEKRIEVESSYTNKGSFNLTYVSAKPGTIPIILLSYIIPSWDLVDLNNERIDTENRKDISTRGKLDLEQAKNNSIIVAFNKTNTPYKIESTNLVVYHVLDICSSNFEVGDIILSINNNPISTMSNLKEILSNSNIDDTLKVKVKRSNKTITIDSKVLNYENNKVLGLYLIEQDSLSTSKKVTFNFSNSESGSSAGLMNTLEIYNQLTSTDITKGYKIAGTGTIDKEGNVGEIAGVKYKLKGSYKKGIDVFIVPEGNYNEAEDIVKTYNMDIILIKAKTFDDVLNSLSKL